MYCDVRGDSMLWCEGRWGVVVYCDVRGDSMLWCEGRLCGVL